MPGGALFEVVLVVLFVFVTMSAIVSSAQELLFQTLGWRSRKLRNTVEKMLSDSEYKNEISRRIYRHPLVAGEERSRKHITYIEPSSFALALAHAVQPANSSTDPLEDLPNSIEALRDGELKRRLQLMLPPASSTFKREDIEKAVSAWFDTAARKTGEAYKADAKGASYILAAVATVALNVSPIEITQRLLADDALRTTFASAVPDLAPMLYNPGEGVPVATQASNTQALEGQAQQSEADANQMRPEDLERILSLYKCSESRLSLPVGWAWMADATTAMETPSANSIIGGKSEADACSQAIADAQASDNPALTASLTKLNLTSQTSFKREYGPSFETDHPLMIFVGWIIMMIAAGQGAPFWFNLLQRFVRR